MICTKCGYQVNEGEAFCNNCGNQLQQANFYPNNEGMNNVQDPMSNMNNSYNNFQTNGNVDPNYNGFQNNGNMNSGHNNAQNNSSQGIPMVVGIVVFLIMLLIIGIMGFIMISKGGDDEGATGGERVVETAGENEKETGTKEKDAPEKKDKPVVVSKKTQKVKFGNYQIAVPRELLYETDEDTLIIYDEDETWCMYLKPEQAKFSDIKRGKSKMKAYYEGLGATIGSLDVKTISGNEMLVGEIDMYGEKALYVYSKADANNILCTAIMKVDGTYGHDLLNDMASVIGSIEPATDSGFGAEIKIDQEKLLSEVIK